MFNSFTCKLMESCGLTNRFLRRAAQFCSTIVLSRALAPSRRLVQPCAADLKLELTGSPTCDSNRDVVITLLPPFPNNATRRRTLRCSIAKRTCVQVPSSALLLPFLSRRQKCAAALARMSEVDVPKADRREQPFLYTWVRSTNAGSI